MDDILEKSPLFRGLNISEIGKMIDGVAHRIKTYEAGELIAIGGDKCNLLHILLRGSVKGEMIDFSGRVLKIEDITAPRPLAVAFLFGNNNRFPVTITSNTAVRMLILPRASVMTLMQINETFLKNYLNAVCSRTQFISDKLRFLSFKSLKGKLAYYLLELDKEQHNDGQILFTSTHEELADLFGVARPSLSRSFGELHRLGVIKVEGKRVQILNKEMLMKEK